MSWRPAADDADLTEEQRDLVATWEMVASAARMANLLSIDRLVALIESIDRSDTMGPFIDPTRWMQARDNLHTMRECVHAMLVFRRTLEPLRPKLPPER